MHRDTLSALLSAWLEPGRFTDVAENGVQVEGKDEVRRVATGVSANRAFIDAALAWGADAIVVHHGLVWGGGIRRLDGWMKERVRRLLAADASLFAFHLPLDAHPRLGNNAGLADALGVGEERVPFGRYKGQPIGTRGTLTTTCTLDALVARATAEVGPPLAVFGSSDRTVSSIGVCTGGAPDMLHDAIAERLDCYVTGEVTEWVKAVADESGTAFLALGHHRTERFGALRLATALAAEGLETRFIDVENPA